MNKKILTIIFIICFLNIFFLNIKAYYNENPKNSTVSTEEKKQIKKIQEEDVTKPISTENIEDEIRLFDNRKVILKNVNIFNIFAFLIQYSVEIGVPSNTILLILLLPFLITGVVFSRHIIGFNSIGLLFPIALSITFISTGIIAGLILLSSILLTSSIARFFLKKVKIMQIPKVAISMLFVSLSIFFTLLFSAKIGILAIKQLSIFPILFLILLSEQVIKLNFEKTKKEIFNLTLSTVLMGIFGYLFLIYKPIQNFILLYPEFIFILIPINILIGRYFGLRLTEYYRFMSISKWE